MSDNKWANETIPVTVNGITVPTTMELDGVTQKFPYEQTVQDTVDADGFQAVIDSYWNKERDLDEIIYIITHLGLTVDRAYGLTLLLGTEVGFENPAWDN